MRYIASCISVLSALAIVGPAMAAELPATPKRERPAPQRAERPAPQQTAQQGANWNGGQLGGSNGGSGVNNNFVEPGAYLFSGCAPPGSSSSFGSPICAETPFSFSTNTQWKYTAGGFFGYRVQVGGWVVGVEGDVYYQNAETTFAQTGRPAWFSTTGFETFTGSVKQGTNGSFRARVGGLVTPWTLVYVTGGLAIGEISGSFSYLACTTSPCNSGTSVFGAASWSETRAGGTVGVGAETELFLGWKGRLEYRYTDFGSITKDVALSNNVSGTCSPTVCGNLAHIETKASNHRITVGLGFDL
jgi:outer membrane immunogenic protein